jgi:pantothenate kinase-related protein Tda10
VSQLHPFIAAPNPLAPTPKMKTCVKLIDETMQFCDVLSDSFMDQNDFLVVGVLGQQSVGKSTIMSLIASGNPSQSIK